MKLLKLTLHFAFLLTLLFSLGAEAFEKTGHAASCDQDIQSFFDHHSSTGVTVVKQTHDDCESECSDPCHAGPCHFGHCSVLLSQINVRIELVENLTIKPIFAESFIQSPYLEGLRRPPKT